MDEFLQILMNSPRRINHDADRKRSYYGWGGGATSGGVYGTTPGQTTQTIQNPSAYDSQLGDVAATMFGQAPNTNMANMLAASGYTNRYGGQVSTPHSSADAYQNLMNRQSAQVASQPTSITVPTTNTGGK